MHKFVRWVHVSTWIYKTLILMYEPVWYMRNKSKRTCQSQFYRVRHWLECDVHTRGGHETCYLCKLDLCFNILCFTLYIISFFFSLPVILSLGLIESFYWTNIYMCVTFFLRVYLYNILINTWISKISLILVLVRACPRQVCIPK